MLILWDRGFAYQTFQEAKKLNQLTTDMKIKAGEGSRHLQSILENNGPSYQGATHWKVQQ